MIRYFFGAFGTAVCLPAIQKIGVGWFSTISALFLVVSTLAVYVNVLYGRSWRDKIDSDREERKHAEET
jgi:hypothetical protein